MDIQPGSQDKMQTKKEENPLFVGITDGNELRRSMLECSKDILESLKEHEKFKNLRHEKVTLINKFKKDLKDVSQLISNLRKCLPKVKDIGIKKPKVEKVKVQKPKMVKVEKPKAKTELERLEEELAGIESKLNSLS